MTDHSRIKGGLPKRRLRIVLAVIAAVVAAMLILAVSGCTPLENNGETPDEGTPAAGDAEPTMPWDGGLIFPTGDGSIELPDDEFD